MTGEVVSGYRLLRGLGARALPAYAAIAPRAPKPEAALCVVEQLAREPGVSAEAAAEFLRDAKRLAQLHHPNIVRVRDVVVGTSTVLLVTDWIDGEALSEIEKTSSAKGSRFPLATSLRILVDLVEGLSALHELRDAKREPLHLVHAEVAPRNVIVGVDGRSILAHPLRAPSGASHRHAPEVVGYLAPEVLLGDQTADQRADVYGVGVLLWEALMGQRMHADGEDVGEIVMRILGGKIEAPSAPADAPWAALLAEAAKKATAPDPSIRFASATEMLSELRRTIGARLAPKTQIAGLVENVAGERIRERRRELAKAQTQATAERDTPPVVVTTDDASKTPVVSVPIDALPPSSIPVEHEAPSAAPSSASRLSAPPSSADVVEVIEMEVPPDRPSRPRAPPPLRPRERAIPAERPEPPPPSFPRPPATSKTDVGSLALVSTPAIPITPEPMPSRMRWMLAGGGAVAAIIVAWFLARGTPERTDAAESPVSSASVGSSSSSGPGTIQALAPPTKAAPSASARAPDSPSGSSEASPFEPPADKDAPAPPKTASGKEAAPFPSAPPAAPPGPASPSPPPPAVSSPHPKKRVYDPMGI